jgi:Rrf2 family transcriptional regulator, nitric oxide-sensitive transcriptional repressor
MRLTQHTDYALRVLMYAASLWPDGRLASIQEIARDYGISRNHLMKVVHRLAQLGLLHTRRGRNGGLRLASDPATTHLGKVVRAVEEDMAITECFAGPSSCPLQGACATAEALERARAAFLAELDRTTLADLVPKRSAKARQVIAFPASLRTGGRR